MATTWVMMDGSQSRHVSITYKSFGLEADPTISLQ